MLKTFKVYAGIAVTAAFSILFALFKYKSKKLEETRIKLADAKREIKIEKVVKEVNRKVEKDYINKLNRIGKDYDDKEKEAYKDADAPLTPSLLERLRRNQNVSKRSDTTPK